MSLRINCTSPGDDSRPGNKTRHRREMFSKSRCMRYECETTFAQRQSVIFLLRGILGLNTSFPAVVGAEDGVWICLKRSSRQGHVLLRLYPRPLDLL